MIATPHHPRARTPEHRSPRALAHDPPALKAEWLVEEDVALDAFLREVRDRVGDDASHERLLRHGGLHLDRRRLCDFAEPPEIVPAGTHVVAYWFACEPEPLVLPEGGVLLDRDGLVAYDKPAWWTTQGTRASRFASLQRALAERLGCPGLTPVNRIDRETTGVLLFARTSRAASEAGKQLIARSVAKEYCAVVTDCGALPETWEVRGRMVRARHPSHSLFVMSGGAEGDESHTRFRVLARGRGLALVQAEPVTGRTHQIRVHLASGGRPILGDSLYGAGWDPERPSATERMLLHCRATTLRVGGQLTRIEAPLPADFPEIAP